MSGPAESRPRVVLVTGAARGIGAAVAGRFAAEGAVVVGGDLDPVDAAPGVDVRPLDVTDPAQVQRWVDDAAGAHGRIDVVVNSAGVNVRAALHDTDEASWARLLEVNVGGTRRVSVAARPHLTATGGCIVNLASTAGLVAIAGAGAYGVTKAAVVHLTKVAALEWAADGIRVNAVAPTIVPTPMTADVLDDPAYMAAKLATIPLGRVVAVDEVVDAVQFLASPDDAGMITGQVLHVDGGVTIA